jgi:hypothetical protein
MPHHLHRIVAISCVLREGDGVQVFSIGEPERDEAATIQKFFDGIEKYTPQLVSWNGSNFDLPVLNYRTLLCGGCATSGTRAPTTRLQVQQLASAATTRGIATSWTSSACTSRATTRRSTRWRSRYLPGKLGVGGPAVWAAYLKGDQEDPRVREATASTPTFYLRFQRQRGIITEEQRQKKNRFTPVLAAGNGKPHWQEFVALWKN